MTQPTTQPPTTDTNHVDEECEHLSVRQISEHDVQCIDCGMVGA